VDRILNELVVSLLDSSVKKGEIPVIIYEAPTGYGKTISSLNFFKVLNSYGISSSLIHVLPMRSITTQLYCKIVNSLGCTNDYCSSLGLDKTIADFIRNLRISEYDVGYQFMDFIDSSKSPFFLKTVLITTFNSFFYNLIRFSVGELRKYKKHYEVPRASIFTSAIVFDEAHLYGGDIYVKDAENSLLTALIVSIKSLAKAYTPLLIETATLPTYLRDLLKISLNTSNVKPKILTFRRDGPKCEDADINSSEVLCYDDDYVDKCLKVRWKTDVLEGLDSNLVKDLVMSGLRVLIVRNTVEKAVDTYRKLKSVEGSITLIHGRFTDHDRKIKLKRVLEDSKIVVATQVIEAGVDVSFDVLITDAATPASVIQRAGRVARRCDDNEKVGYVYVIKSEGDGIYDEKLTRDFLSKLIEIKSLGYMIDWRIPSKSKVYDRISYLELIEELYSNYRPQLDPERYVYLIDIATRPLIKYEEIYDMIRRFDGIVYSSLLFPVYVGEDLLCRDFSDCQSEILQNSVALSKDFLMRHLNTLVELKDNSVAVLYLECDEELDNCDIVKDYTHISNVINYPLFLRRVVKGEVTLTPLALVGRNENYSSELGYGVT